MPPAPMFVRMVLMIVPVTMAEVIAGFGSVI